MEKMIGKFSKKYDVPTETIARAFLSCPPEKDIMRDTRGLSFFCTENKKWFAS